ncbi:MAG TPA: transglutaminase-like domain-containing protein [Terriglobales bacterium]|jgi:transglutaminase-like putative cysteine protease
MPRRSLLLIALFALCIAAHAQKERHFTFHYSFTVRNVPAGKTVRVWMPLAHSDASQDVRVVAQSGDLSLKRTQDHEYGNPMLYAEATKADKSEYQFSIDYDVVRREHTVLVNGKPVTDARPDRAQLQLARFLQPDRLVPITGLPQQLALEQTKGAASALDKAHAIYEYVFHTLRYDKTGTGWGHGDTLWACDSKRGNCTDFHSLFISMARSQRIPARFEIGFPLPADKHAAEVPGYHCWADFHVNSIGWIPVDISEAWKHQDLHDYYFGAHDPNRVQFTVGRDLRLNPPQAGPPLNYFIYPYVEVSDKEYPNVAIAFSFKDSDVPTTEGKTPAP